MPKRQNGLIVPAFFIVSIPIGFRKIEAVAGIRNLPKARPCEFHDDSYVDGRSQRNRIKLEIVRRMIIWTDSAWPSDTHPSDISCWMSIENIEKSIFAGLSYRCVFASINHAVNARTNNVLAKISNLYTSSSCLS